MDTFVVYLIFSAIFAVVIFVGDSKPMTAYKCFRLGIIAGILALIVLTILASNQ